MTLRFEASTLALLLALAFFYQLGRPPLFDVDEGAFAEASREMLASGDWITPRLNGEPRFDKPILIYWLQSLSVSLLGLNEFALRLPSALAASAWALAVWGFTRARFGPQTAILASTLLASNLLVLSIGRAATADAVLNLWLALSLFDAWRYLERPHAAPLLRLYLWLGLGLLTKGPIAVALPFLVLSVFLLSAGRWREWLRGSFYLPGWLLLLAIAGPWYALILHAQGDAFIAGFWLKHNLARFSDTLEQHGGFWGYYLLLLPIVLLPHTALLPSALGRLRQNWAEPLPRFLWLWFLLVLGLFSFSQTQLPHYLLYGLTPLFILLAQTPPPRKFWLLGPLLLGLLWLGLPEILTRFPPQDAYLRDSLSTMATQFDSGYRGVILIALLATLALLLRPLSLHGWLFACGLHTLVLVQAVAPALGETLQAPIKRAGYQARTLNLPVVAWQAHLPSFSLYRGAITPQRAPQPGEVVFTRRENLPRLGPHRVLYAQGGVALARILAPP